MLQKSILNRYIRQRKRAKVVSIGILIIGLLLILIWLLTYFGTNIGMFTVSVSDKLSKYGIGISAHEDGTYISQLSTNSVRCTPVAYEDIDFVKISEHDGDYSSNRYLAYTFYVKNTGENVAPVHVSLELLESTKHVDSAIRIMLIRNGAETIYLKDDENIIDPEDKTPYDEAKYFISSKYIFVEDEYDFMPGEIRKYTIIIWLEGWDAQCTDDIIGGAIKLKLVFEVPRENNS